MNRTHNSLLKAFRLTFTICTPLVLSCSHATKQDQGRRPNILFVLSDDQSFPYASVYGTSGVETPVFDSVARAGILFYNAFAAAPQCSPSRAAILTGRNIWQLAEAGTHGSSFPKRFQVFTDLLEKAGYQIGYTGKGWAPGDWKISGRTRNPAGPAYNRYNLVPPDKGISRTDYFRNFVDFWTHKKKDAPFFFWYGSHEPHRPYARGSGAAHGLKASAAFIPGFLPRDSVAGADIADYAFEISWFDRELGRMIGFLRSKGELDNTLIVVTSDNGMPFPSAKANLMEYGCHVPLAICWPDRIQSGRVSRQLVSLIDLAPTFLQLAGIARPAGMTGRSMTPLLVPSPSDTGSYDRKFVLTGRERHSDARPDDVGYPSRAIRTGRFLLILNLKSDRWPAGNPPPAHELPLPPQYSAKDFKPIGLGYSDIDEPSPTKELMIAGRRKWPALFAEGFEKRPAVQLFDVVSDPACTVDLARNPRYAGLRDSLEMQLRSLLAGQGDPRMLGYGDIFDSYPRFGLMRNWGGFQQRGAYNPAFEVKRGGTHQ